MVIQIDQFLDVIGRMPNSNIIQYANIVDIIQKQIT